MFFFSPSKTSNIISFFFNSHIYVRYVRFGPNSSTASTKSATSPTRPSAAAGAGAIVGLGAPSLAVGGSNSSGAGGKGTYSSEWKSHFTGSNVAGSGNGVGEESGQLPIYLSIYKQKNDVEPVVRYPLSSIASCYIGDVAGRHKKKSVVLPTLVVNLRTEPALSSSRSFRRRSHDMPPKDSVKRESPGKETLLFRPGSEANSLERWAREIQSYLIPSSSHSNATVNTLESAFREKFSDPDDIPGSSSSLFIINGEPTTALLSPSLRSMASNLSSIDSDDNGSLLSSPASEMNSPKDLDRADRRPSLHIATKLRNYMGPASPASPASPDIANTNGFPSMHTASLNPTRTTSPTADPVPARRETILDRFFSTAPSSPSTTSAPVPMNSIARFEALIEDMESGELRARDESLSIRNHPRRIPSPTQRALEYVSTGYLDEPSPSPPSSLSSSTSTMDPVDTTHLSPDDPRLPSPLTESLGLTLSRQPSEASLGTTTSVTNSQAETQSQSLGVSNSKRHSLAEFSMVRIATPPLFQIAGSRRGSHSDIPRTSESYDDGPAPLATPNFSSHPRIARALFGGFSF
ncbi:unnamed protein product [Tuber melanosporum]|uniref:(Perigord truffle) hypothetical protein n=1 Tax=Tuber melanosporum (strain Mel28) TaxID=656061 RepID=D5GB03_TUBMM|nr:uncharacterized protein GSTUM_00005384001 [Tuber melanosporum]CAZ81696.1 unnamed protein product [Tuber melanosporum]